MRYAFLLCERWRAAFGPQHPPGLSLTPCAARAHTHHRGLSYDECASGRAKGDACFWAVRDLDCDAYAQVSFFVCVRASAARRRRRAAVLSTPHKTQPLPPPPWKKIFKRQQRLKARITRDVTLFRGAFGQVRLCVLRVLLRACVSLSLSLARAAALPTTHTHTHQQRPLIKIGPPNSTTSTTSSCTCRR